MNRTFTNLLLLIGILVAIPGAVTAADRGSITVRGRTATMVTKAKISLGDIAMVDSKASKDEETVIALKKIEVAKAPEPGEKVELEARDILAALRTAGVDVNSFGYMFPRTIEVERASRTLTYHEVEQAVIEHLQQDRGEASLKSLRYSENIKVAPGPVALRVRSSRRGKSGTLALAISAKSDDAPAVRFQASAQIDEWREVPVARQAIQPGQIVSSEDFKMARLNTRNIPKDAATTAESLIGFSATRPIGVGDVFKRNYLLIPPVVRAGSLVTLRYRSRLLEATATGKALESGAKGDEIKVRNTASGNVVSATIIEPGLVGVTR